VADDGPELVLLIKPYAGPRKRARVHKGRAEAEEETVLGRKLGEVPRGLHLRAAAEVSNPSSIKVE
jgi:hypothetical protein